MNVSIDERASGLLKTRALDVQWTREGRVSGLLRAVLHNLPAQASGTVLVSIDGAAEFAGEAMAGTDGKVHVNIHTHLLGDGLRHVGIEWRAGDLRREAAVKVDVQNAGALADCVRAALRTHAVPSVFLGDCDASYYAGASRECGSWIDGPEAPTRVRDMLADGVITPAESEMLLRFLRDGFVVLDQKLPEDLLAAADAALDHAVESGYQDYQYGSSQRLEQMHCTYPGIRDLWLHAPVHRFLSLVFDAPSQPCQSLVYVFGSQQDAHQDTIHLTPFPAGMMCGVWMALEDVRPGSGELMVYPGSHRLPRVYMSDVGAAKVRGDWAEFGEKVVGRWAGLLDEARIEPRPYMAKRGDILIWHENLMHAGSVRREPSLSRRSVVTHNFARGAIVYYDSSGDVGHVHEPEP